MASPTTCPTNVYDITSYSYDYAWEEGNVLLYREGRYKDTYQSSKNGGANTFRYLSITPDEDDSTLFHIWACVGGSAHNHSGYYITRIEGMTNYYSFIFAPYNKQISTAKNNFVLANNLMGIEIFQSSDQLKHYFHPTYTTSSSYDTRKLADQFTIEKWEFQLSQKLIKDGYKYKYDQESLIDSYASFYDYTKLSATSSGFYKPTFDCMGASEFTGLQPFEIIDFEANEAIAKLGMVGETLYINNPDVIFGKQENAFDLINKEIFERQYDVFGYETLKKRVPWGPYYTDTTSPYGTDFAWALEGSERIARDRLLRAVGVTHKNTTASGARAFLICVPVCKIQLIPQAMKASHKLYFYSHVSVNKWSWSTNASSTTDYSNHYPCVYLPTTDNLTKTYSNLYAGNPAGYSMRLSFPHTLSLNYQAPRHLLESIYTAYYRGTKMKKQILPKPCICHCDNVAFPLSSQKTTEVSTATSYQYALTFEVIKVSKALETEDNSTTPTFIFTDEASLELPYSDDTSNPQWEKEFKIYTNADTLAFSTSDDSGNLQIPVEQYTSNVLVYDSTRSTLDAETAKTSIAKVTSTESATTMSANLSNINETSGEGYDFTKIEILEVLSLTELEVDNKLRLISDSTSKAPTPTIKTTFWDDLVADFLDNITDSDYEKYYCLDEESLNTLQDQLAGVSIDVDDYIFSDLNDVSGVLFTLKPSVALGFTNQHQILSKDDVVLKVKFAKVYTLASTQLSEEVTPTFEDKDTWCYDGVNKKYRNVHLLGVKPTMSKCVIA